MFDAPNDSIVPRVSRVSRERRSVRPALTHWILRLGIASLASIGCYGKDPYNPGTPIGTYHVTGALIATSDSCGGAVGAPDPWSFDIRLAQDQTSLYWEQGGLPVGGFVDSHGHAELRSSDTRTVHEADPRAGLGFCSMTRDDTVDVSLAAGESTFTATLVYVFSATSGTANSDCSDQLVSSGGTYAALPCTIRYDLVGTRIGGTASTASTVSADRPAVSDAGASTVSGQ